MEESSCNMTTARDVVGAGTGSFHLLTSARRPKSLAVALTSSLRSKWGDETRRQREHSSEPLCKKEFSSDGYGPKTRSNHKINSSFPCLEK